MPRLAVVLDTNAYRGIGKEAFDALRRDESHHSVVAFASYIVATELLAHLAAEDDRDFGACLHATARLGTHCSRWDGSASNLGFMQLADSQIIRQLFGVSLESNETKAAGYSTIIGAITSSPCPASALQFQEGLTQLRDQVAQAEQEFADRLWNKVVMTLEPSALSWNDITKSAKRAGLLAALDAGHGLGLVAGTIVDRAAGKAGLRLTAPERDRAIARAIVLFPTAIHHHDLLIRELVTKGQDMRKPERANSVWDHDLTFSTAPGANVSGIPLVLVTADPLILRAAAAGGMTSRIWALVDYRKRLTDRDRYVDAHLDGDPRQE